MSQQFKDFIVVVTGASTGLGRALAVEVASQGATAVIVNYAHNAADAEQTALLVRAQGAEAVECRAMLRWMPIVGPSLRPLRPMGGSTRSLTMRA